MANQKMWVRNYYNLLIAPYCQWQNSGVVSVPTADSVVARLTDGTYENIINTNGICYYSPGLVSVSSCSGYGFEYASYPRAFCGGDFGIACPITVMIGGGDDAPTYDDYHLSLPYASNVSFLSTSQLGTTYDEVNHIYTRKFKIALAYTGSESISVNEFGIYTQMLYGTQNSSYDWYFTGKPLMIYHEVFENTITLEQNDNIEITIEESAQHPNYVPYPSST